MNAASEAGLADDETPGFARIGLRFPSIDAAVYQMVALGDVVTAIEPPELIAAVVARAREALALLAS